MPTSARLPIRPNVLKITFAIYAALSLVSMAIMSIGAALLFVAFIMSKNLTHLKAELRSECKRLPSRVYLYLSMALALGCVLSLIGAILFPLGYGGNFVEVHFLKDIAKLWYLFWPLVLVIGLRRLNEKDQKDVFHVWLGAFAILSVIGIFQFFTGWPRVQDIPGIDGRYHATLFLGHHLSVASILIFPFFACLDYGYSAFESLKGKFRPSKQKSFLGYFITALVGGITLFLGYSRTLWIALTLGVIIWIVWRIISSRKKLFLPFVLLFILTEVLILQIPAVQKRISIRMGINARQDLWEANFEFFKLRPFTGTGWHHNLELSGYYLMDRNHVTDVFSGHAHNNFLDMLGGTGLLGAMAWVAWCVGIFWILLRRPRGPLRSESALLSYFKRGLVCAWIVFHINGLTQVNFWDAKVEHQVAWVIAWALL